MTPMNDADCEAFEAWWESATFHDDKAFTRDAWLAGAAHARQPGEPVPDELREAVAVLKDLLDLLRKEAPGTPLNNDRFVQFGIRAYNAVADAERAMLSAAPSPASPEKGTERMREALAPFAKAAEGMAGVPDETPVAGWPATVADLRHAADVLASLPAEPEGEEEATIKATQISMGHGLVDVVDITHEGRKGILFHPRDHHLPIGGDGSIELGPRWPGPEDVVIWIDDPRGAEVIQHYLAPLLPATHPTAPKPAEVRVKGLEWGPYPNPVFASDDVAVAVIGFGQKYQVQRDPDASGYMAFLAPTFGTLYWKSSGHSTLDSAKAAAQADFDQRILSALEPSPAPAAEPPADGIERASEYLCRTAFHYGYAGIRDDGSIRDRGYEPVVFSQWGGPKFQGHKDDLRAMVREIVRLAAPAAEEFRRGAGAFPISSNKEG